jgi:hypothetical protein
MMHPREFLFILWAVSEKAAFLEWDRNAYLGIVHKHTARESSIVRVGQKRIPWDHPQAHYQPAHWPAATHQGTSS